jgi:dihydrolipoamide dehydrogenase
LSSRVTIIEKNAVGGTCLNWGCIPTKALASSSDLLYRTRRLKEFGIEVSGEISPNLSRIQERIAKIVSLQAKGIHHLLAAHKITFKEGRGQIVSPSEVSCSLHDAPPEIVPADRIIVATGSRPYEISGMLFDGKHILSTNEVFNLRAMPKSLLVIGAGISGCEFSCIFRQLGSDVTLIEKLPRALAMEDIEISSVFEREMKKRGVRFLPGTTVDAIDVLQDGMRVTLSDGKTVDTERILVSAGRAPNSGDIGAERVGLLIRENGELSVNSKMETNVSGIFAIGDVIGGRLLAHVASAEGIVAARNAMGDHVQIDYSAVPSAIFTSPEIASVGMREQEAAERGISIRVGRFPFRTLARSHIAGDIEGMVKVIADQGSDMLLGVHIIGPHASDLIHEAALAISRRLSTKDIMGVMHAHPTFSEVFQEAVADVHGQAIHIRNV